MQLIDGKKIAKKISNKTIKEIRKMNNDSTCPLKRPNLAIILVGEREDSKLYVAMKEREAKKIGIDTHLYKCSRDISESEIFEMIDSLNNDKTIDAILVQLPLPVGYDTDGIILAIDPEKDVDRFHPKNIEVFLKTCDHNHIMPPLIASILAILDDINCDLKEKNVCVISNSDIFGLTCAKALECKQANVVTAKVDDKDLISKTKQADILISVVGKLEFIKKEMIKKDTVIIDIGITKKDKKIFGDVDAVDVAEKVGFLTPVPGGVGPITIAMLFKNTLELYKRRRQDG
jgi:methylenetetrahydrofolate dehydrogenase (NADP+)/methenyltetrahydrofolate cyclohydrolase